MSVVNFPVIFFKAQVQCRHLQDWFEGPSYKDIYNSAGCKLQSLLYSTPSHRPFIFSQLFSVVSRLSRWMLQNRQTIEIQGQSGQSLIRFHFTTMLVCGMHFVVLSWSKNILCEIPATFPRSPQALLGELPLKLS